MYRVRHPRGDPRKSRVFVVVSRQALLDSRFSTATCAPVYSRRDGIDTQVEVGIDDGLKHESSIHCDELVAIQKAALTDYVGALSSVKVRELDQALKIALALDE